VFTQVIDSLTTLGFVDHKPGFQKWLDGFDPGGPKLPHFQYASRFKATPKLLQMAEQAGVPPTEARDHFITELPRRPLQLRTSAARNEYGQKVRGKPMRFERTPKTDELEAWMHELNEFFDQFELRGGTHRGFIRIFNQGDDPDFDWNMGGRLYSQGEDNYQQMSKEDRLRMTINGEQVCEIDIRASYLTIYHSWFREQLDLSNDPYVLPGLGAGAREIVKLWFVATFGSDGHLKRWPAEIVAQYREDTGGRTLGKDFPLKLIRQKAIERFPLMERWGEQKSAWATLMWHESVAMFFTMRDLMREYSVPSMSVHDSLIVPMSKQEIAKKHLASRYFWVTQVEPVLVVHEPLFGARNDINDNQHNESSASTTTP
jgi:hypothetical protein